MFEDELIVVTEKGISDDAFCHFLWEEEEGSAKRKRSFLSSVTFDLVQQVLSTGTPNKNLYVEQNDSGNYQAKSYEKGKDFWVSILVPDTELYLSLAVQSVELLRDPFTWKVWRKQLYTPRNQERYTIERYIHVAILNAMSEVSQLPRKILTTWPNDRLASDPDSPDFEKWYDGMVEWAKGLHVRAQGSERTPNPERCSSCFWKACPKKHSPSRVTESF